ncbi:MAG: hypothetical protein HOV80_39415 [Polyangiaceae bacterium]|nr:hypothetical protein [Polyangiaceae bacterium]
MIDGSWLTLTGHLSAVVRQCERRIDERDAAGATRAYADLEAGVDRLAHLPARSQPQCHALLVADLQAVMSQLAAKIRALR